MSSGSRSMRAGTIAGGIKSDGDWIIDGRTITFQPAVLNGAAIDLLKTAPGVLNVQLRIPAEGLLYSASVAVPPHLVGGELAFFVAWDGEGQWRMAIEGVLVLSTFPGERSS